MASLPILTILEQSHVSPPPATVTDASLPLAFFDILWLPFSPVHHVFFYELPAASKTHFTETIVPSLKQSLSITLQHFFPFSGNLIVFSTPTLKPEIRYVNGDSVAFTVAESTLDFNDLTGNHPRDCGKFYHLIPLLPEATKESDHVKIPVFSIQVTFFPNSGISIGVTNHHTLGDASTRFCFMKAWTSIARTGSDESFLANGTLPFFDRVVNYPKLDELYLKNVGVETIFSKGYQPPRLSGPTDKVRATFILTRTVINGLKKWVSTQLPTLPYVSSLTVLCAYTWSCIAKSRNDELEIFGIAVDCRARMDPPIPAAYFGNCVVLCLSIAKIDVLTGNEGFLNAAKLLGENLHKMLTDETGIVKDKWPFADSSSSQGIPTTIMGVAGTTKLKFYDMDYGWGKPTKYETISTDYSDSISLSTCKESNEDLELGVCLSATEMEAFVPIFSKGLEAYL